MRRIAVAFTALAALFAMALPAHADPPGLYLDAGNGARTVPVHHPDHPEWFVTVKVETVFGFVPGGDAGPEFASAFAGISDGPGALRWQVNNPRLRIDQDGVATDQYVNDYFPSPVANPRTNTPSGCTVNAAVIRPPGYINAGAGVSRLYDERAPKDGVCEDATQLVPNPLNSAGDYSPDTTNVQSRGDWVNIGFGVPTSGVTAVRVFFLVRWNDNSLTAHSVGSNFAAYGT